MVPTEECEARGVIEKGGGIIRNRYICSSEPDGSSTNSGRVRGYRPGGDWAEKKQKYE